jgi:hypothetical protein
MIIEASQSHRLCHRLEDFPAAVSLRHRLPTVADGDDVQGRIIPHVTTKYFIIMECGMCRAARILDARQ